MPRRPQPKGPQVGGDWYVHLQDRVQGPFDLDALKSAAADGRISKQTLVRRGGNGAWVAAENVDGLVFVTRQIPSVSPAAPVSNSLPVSFADDTADFAPSVRPRRKRTSPMLIWNIVLIMGTLVAAGVILQKRDPAFFKGLLAFLGKPQPVVAANPAPVAAAAQQPPVVRRKERPAKPKPFNVAPLPVAIPFVNAAGNQAAGPIPRLPVFRPVPPKRVPATAEEIRALDAKAGHLLSAKDALALFDGFPASHTMTAAQKAAFDKARKPWEERAKQNLMRQGAKWVPAAEALLARHEAERLVKRAFELLNLRDFVGARKALEKAINTDQCSPVAAYTLGLLCSVASPDKRSPQYAEKYFKIALHREPGDAATLNNLALAEVRLHKYAEAVRNLKEASANPSENPPSTDKVTHNLGRFISEARLGKIHPSEALLDEATRLHDKAIAVKKAEPENEGSCWLYIPLKDPLPIPLVVASPQSQSADIYDDHCCTVCNGRGRVRCPHCNHGSTLVDDPQTTTIPIPFGNPIVSTEITTVQRQCTNCGGTGYVKCPYCVSGYDKGDL